MTLQNLPKPQDNPLDAALEVQGIGTNIVESIKGLVVNNEISFNDNAEYYKQARNWKNRIEEHRKMLVAPYVDEQRRINTQAKWISEPFDQVIELANRNSAAYLKQQRDLLEQKKREVIRAAEVLGITNYSEELPEVKKETETVTVKRRVVKKFRVIDLSKVPVKFLQINEEAVNLYLKLGIDTIEGLEIYEETIETLSKK